MTNPAIIHRVNAEAGLASLVKHDTYLYFPEGICDNPHYVVPTTDLKKIKKCPNRLKLKSGQRIIVKPLPIKSAKTHTQQEYHPSLVLVTTYQEVGQQRADMPESGPIVTMGQTGVMSISALAASGEYEIPFNGDIFPPDNKLSSDHIFQGDMGDCFLLASLIAILKTQSADGTVNGDTIISKIIRQEGRYSFVQLYNPVTLEKHELKIANTLRCTNTSPNRDPHSFSCHEPKVNHAFNWVHMLEKAFAAFGWRSDLKAPVHNLNSASFLSVYSGGGDPAVALKVLTGQKAINTSITLKPLLSPWSYESLTRATTYYLRKELANDETADNYIEQYIVEHPELAGLEKTVWLAWGKYLTELNSQQDAEGIIRWEKLLKSFEDKIYIHDLPIIFEQLQSQNPPIPQTIMSKFREWSQEVIKTIDPNSGAVTLEGRFVGAVGTGIYTKQQLDQFNLIQTELSNHHFLVASTGEIKDVAGLRGPHAYAIEGVEVKKINGHWVKFIKLINPWGNTGRVYNWTNDDKWYAQGTNWAKEDINKGHFSVELSEFSQFFATLTSCPNPNAKKPQLLPVANSDSHSVIEKVGSVEKSISASPQSIDQPQVNSVLSKAVQNPHATNNTSSDNIILAALLKNRVCVETKPDSGSSNVEQSEEDILFSQLNDHLTVKTKPALKSHAVCQNESIVNNIGTASPLISPDSTPITTIKAPVANTDEMKNKQYITYGLRFFDYQKKHQQVSFTHSRQKTAEWITTTASKLSSDDSINFLYACYQFTYKENSDLTKNIKRTLNKSLNGSIAPGKLKAHELSAKLNCHELRISFIKSLFAFIESEETSLSYKLSNLCNKSITNILNISANDINANCDYARCIIAKLLNEHDESDNHKLIGEVLKDIDDDISVKKPHSISNSLKSIIDEHRSGFDKKLIIS